MTALLVLRESVCVCVACRQSKVWFPASCRSSTSTLSASLASFRSCRRSFPDLAASCLPPFWFSTPGVLPHTLLHIFTPLCLSFQLFTPCSVQVVSGCRTDSVLSATPCAHCQNILPYCTSLDRICLTLCWHSPAIASQPWFATVMSRACLVKVPRLTVWHSPDTMTPTCKGLGRPAHPKQQPKHPQRCGEIAHMREICMFDASFHVLPGF